MPGAETAVAPTLHELPGARWSWQARFTPDCEHVVLDTMSCSDATAIDLITQQVFHEELLCLATLMPSGRYYQLGGGMESIYELRSGPERTSAWQPRIAARSTYAYATHRDAMFVAGPLEGRPCTAYTRSISADPARRVSGASCPRRWPRRSAR
jgi:hypothetical protein